MNIELLQKLIKEKAGGSQSSFALMIKKSPSQVNQWLTGRRPIGPKIERDIEDALGISLRNHLVVANHSTSSVLIDSNLRDPLDRVAVIIQELAFCLDKIAPEDKEIAAGVMASLARHPERYKTYVTQIKNLLEFNESLMHLTHPQTPLGTRIHARFAAVPGENPDSHE